MLSADLGLLGLRLEENPDPAAIVAKDPVDLCDRCFPVVPDVGIYLDFPSGEQMLKPRVATSDRGSSRSTE